MENIKLTATEQEIMMILWSAGEPLSSAEIMKRSEGRAWKKNTIYAFLDKMLKKGVIEVDGYVSAERKGQALRAFRPTLGFDEYWQTQIPSINMSNESFPVVSRFICSILMSDTITDKELDKIEAVIREKRGQ